MATPEAEEYPGKRRWPRLTQDAAITLWPSFLVASVATMVCFAFLDPILIGHDDYPPPAFATRMTGYAVGFFFFWLITALSSLLTLYLARTEQPVAKGHRRSASQLPDDR